jgi:hypothetical protein
MADFVVSTTDPDATVMPTKGEGRHLGYHTHYVVDGGKAHEMRNEIGRGGESAGDSGAPSTWNVSTNG